MTDQALREKLRLIRDSDHPASPWARNVVQVMDELKNRPDDPGLLRALGWNVTMLERALITEYTHDASPLDADEIAAIFGLGGDHSDLQ